jgi:hypothetical protein
MSTLSQNVITVLEQAKRRYNGEVQKIAEILDELNDVFKTAAAYEGNDVHSHVSTIRSALPTVSPRGPNEGATNTVSKVRQIREGIMVLDSIIQVDELIYGPEPDFNEFMMGEVKAHMEAELQTFAYNFIYGNTASDPKVIDGLATRYPSLVSNHVIGAGGTGSDLTSVWMVEWGRDSAHLFYPKGSEAGIMSKALGENTLYDSSSKPYRGYEYQVQVKIGMAIPDEDRAVHRLANIESAGTTANLRASGVAENLILLQAQLPRFGRDSVIYVNRTTKGQFDVWAHDKSNAYFTLDVLQDGTNITRFNGAPIAVIEQILDTEAALT